MKRKSKPFTTLVAVILILALNLAGIGFSSYQLLSASSLEPRPFASDAADAHVSVVRNNATQAAALAQPLQLYVFEAQEYRPLIIPSENHFFDNLFNFPFTGMASTGSIFDARFMRAGIWRIPLGDISRITPVPGIVVSPSFERHDAYIDGLALPPQSNNPYTPTTPEASEAVSGILPTVADETRHPAIEGVQTLNYEDAEHDYTASDEENDLSINQEESDSWTEGENAEANPENLEDSTPATAQPNEGEDDSKNPYSSGEATSGDADNSSPNGGNPYPLSDDDNNDYAPESASADDDYLPESADEAEQIDQDSDGQGFDANEDNEDSQEDGRGSAGTANSNDSDGDNNNENLYRLSPAQPSTQNPQTGDNFAILGLAFSSIGFISSSLILAVIVVERKARGY